MANCTSCGEPITLIPSAAERARKCGETPAYYTSLFTKHTECELRDRKEAVSALIERIRNVPK